MVWVGVAAVTQCMFSYGGSLFQWHPALKIGFGYVPTLLEAHDMYNSKGMRIQVRHRLKVSKD